MEITSKRTRTSLSASKPSPWLDLPQLLADRILDRLSLRDYVRFAAVCRSWQSMQKDHYHHRHQRRLPAVLPLRLPLLTSATFQHQKLCLISLFEHDSYSFQLPTTLTKHTRCIASSHGWLLLVDMPPDDLGKPLMFVNPITGQTLCSSPPELMIHRSPIMAAMSCSPVDPDCQTVVVNGRLVSLWRNTEHDWTTIGFSDPLLTSSTLTPPVFCNGKFYCRSSERRLVIISLLPEPTVQLIQMDVTGLPPKCNGDFFLVESQGDLLSVEAGVPHYKKGFQVFKADLDNNKWVKVKSLGDRVLFVGNVGSVSLSAAEFGSVAMWEKYSNNNKIYSSLPPLYTERPSSRDSPWCGFPWEVSDYVTRNMITGPLPKGWTGRDCQAFRQSVPAWIVPDLDSIAQLPRDIAQ